MDNDGRLVTDFQELNFEYQRECKLLAKYFLKSASAMQEVFWGAELYSYIRHHNPMSQGTGLAISSLIIHLHLTKGIQRFLNCSQLFKLALILRKNIEIWLMIVTQSHGMRRKNGKTKLIEKLIY